MKVQTNYLLVALAGILMATGCADQGAIDVESVDGVTAKGKAPGPYIDVDDNGKYSATTDIDLTPCFNSGEQEDADGNTVCEIKKNNGSNYDNGYELEASGSLVLPNFNKNYAFNESVLILVDDGSLTIEDTIECKNCEYVSLEADGDITFASKAGLETDGESGSGLIVNIDAGGDLNMKAATIEIDGPDTTLLSMAADGDAEIRRAKITVDGDVASALFLDADGDLDASAVSAGSGTVSFTAGGDVVAASAKITAKNFDLEADGDIKANGLKADCLGSVWVRGDQVTASGLKVNSEKFQAVADADLSLKKLKANVTDLVYVSSDEEVIATSAQITAPQVRVIGDGNISLKSVKLDVKTVSIETPASTWYVPELDARALRVADSDSASICLNGADLADEVDMSVNLTKADDTTCANQPPAPK